MRSLAARQPIKPKVSKYAPTPHQAPHHDRNRTNPPQAHPPTRESDPPNTAIHTVLGACGSANAAAPRAAVRRLRWCAAAAPAAAAAAATPRASAAAPATAAAAARCRARPRCPRRRRCQTRCRCPRRRLAAAPLPSLAAVGARPRVIARCSAGGGGTGKGRANGWARRLGQGWAS